MTREKSLADLAARWMISCRPYVNVRHYLLAAADIQTRATLRDAPASAPLLSSLVSTPGGAFLPTLFHIALYIALSLSRLASSLPSFLSPSVTVSSRSSLSHASFFLLNQQYTMSLVLSPLARALTFSFRLSSPLSPISQSYPRQRKMPSVSQSRERPAFSA